MRILYLIFTLQLLKKIYYQILKNKQKIWKNKISTNINLQPKNGSMLFIGYEVVKVTIAINKV